MDYKMFPTNHCVVDQTSLPTGFSISLQALDNQVLDYTNVTPIQNFQISQLSDGTFCLVQVSNSEVAKSLNIEGEIEDYKPDLPTALSGNEHSVHLVPSESQFSNLQKLAPNQDKPLIYSCIKCKSESQTLKEYQDHLTWHKYQKKFKCPMCSTGYNIKNNLTIHMALSHPEKNISECPICHKNLTFQRQAGLRSHLMVHHVDEFYTCDQCKGEFDDEGDYLKHVKSHNSDVVIKQEQGLPLTCSFCKLSFKSVKEKKAHVSEHVKLKKIFIKPNKPKKSKTSAEKKFQCKVCQKRFLKFSLLKRHDRVHSGERPYKCNVCEKSFSQKASLQIHKIRHTGIKPYSCTLCPAKFCQKGNLMVHIRKTHTQKDDDSKTYRCPHCTCIFKRIASLNGHVTKIHINEKPSPLGEISNVMKKLMELEKHTVNGDGKVQNNGDNPSSDVTDVSNDDNPKAIISQHGKDGFLRKFLVNIKKLEDERWFLCNHCSSQFKKPSDLVKHLGMHMRGNREDIPNKVQSCQENVAVRDLTQLINPNFKCKLCDGSFNSLKKLNSHICSYKKQPGPSLPQSESKDQADKSTKLYACPICLKVFKDNMQFQTHIRRHKKKAQNQQNKETASKHLPKESTHVSKSNEATSSLLNDKTSMGIPHNSINHLLESTIDPNMFINLGDLDLLDDSSLNEYLDGILKSQNQENVLLNEVQNTGTPPQNILQLGTLQMNELFPKGLTPDIAMENISAQDLHDAGNIFDANIICMNCGGFYTNLSVFQLHRCEKEKSSTESVNTVAEKVVTPPAENKIPEAPSASKSPKKTMPGRSRKKSSHSLECHICKKTLSSNSSYKTHIVSHLTGSSYECSMCKKIFIGRAAYLKHLNQSHSDVSGTLQMSCIYCRKHFKKPSDLARHLRVHTGEKPFICKICNRGFSLKSTLETHERIHGPHIKEFNCPICNSYFSSKSSLTVHLTIHSGQKPYPCSVCNMRFRTIGNRNSHVKLVHIYNKKQRHLKRKTKIKSILESAVAEAVNDVNAAQNNLYFTDNTDYTTDTTLENQTGDLTFSSQNILPSLQEDQMNSETISLLQQLQSSEMIFTSNQTEISSLILDDGPLLNIDSLRDNADNYQVVSMFELAGNVQNDSCESEVLSKKMKKERTEECQACHKKYSSRDVLRKHIKTVHGKNGQFICDKCGTVTGTVNEFIQHLEGHSEELASLSSEQDLNLPVNMDKFSLNGITKDLPPLNIKFELPSSNIDDALFSNLFPLKKI